MEGKGKESINSMRKGIKYEKEKRVAYMSGVCWGQ